MLSAAENNTIWRHMYGGMEQRLCATIPATGRRGGGGRLARRCPVDSAGTAGCELSQTACEFGAETPPDSRESFGPKLQNNKFYSRPQSSSSIYTLGDL
jgi:hypothetical protein